MVEFISYCFVGASVYRVRRISQWLGRYLNSVPTKFLFDVRLPKMINTDKTKSRKTSYTHDIKGTYDGEKIITHKSLDGRV